MNDAMTEDTRAREVAASHFHHPVVLEAGAGTGKTAVLVARVMTWALGPGWARHQTADGDEATAIAVLSRILALTFTEKAAGEMAVRMAQALGAVGVGEQPVGFSFSRVAEFGSAEALARRARALTAHLDRLPVSTIHAWCRRLLAAWPMEAGLHPSMEVDAEGIARREVIDQVIADWVARSFGDVIDADALTLATHGHDPSAVHQALTELGDQGVTADQVTPYPLHPTAAREAVRQIRQDLLMVANWCRGLTSPKVKASDVARWIDDQSKSDHTDDGDPQLAAWREDGTLPQVIETLKKWRAGNLSTQEERKALSPPTPLVMRHARSLCKSLERILKENPEVLAAGHRVLHGLLQDVESRLFQRGSLSFGDLLSRAELLLQQADVAARVRQGLDQILIDEFQDTDARQFRIVGALALSGSPASRPGLFLVGDPKQSIYGWRQADLAAYEDFKFNLARDAGAQVLSLVVNFRSVPPILQAVEHHVRPVMRAVPGVQPPFQSLLASSQRQESPRFHAGGRRPVEYWVTPGQDEHGKAFSVENRLRIEARAMARDIAALHRESQVPWKRVGVLLQRRTSMETFLEAFREEGVPFSADGDRSFYRRREIIDAINLIRVVLDPADHLALVGFLRSSMVGVPDSALIPLWAEKLPKTMTELRTAAPEHVQPLDQAIERARAKLPMGVAGADLARDFAPSLRYAVRAVGALRRSFTEDAADVFVDRLRSAFQGETLEAARYLGSHRAANLDRLYRQVFVALTTGRNGADAVLRELREHLEDLHPERDAVRGTEEIDAVRILTIHLAKGLDFEHVYLPDLVRQRAGGGPAQGSRVLKDRNGRSQSCLFGQSVRGFPDAEDREEEVRQAELARLLYVALTRARERLVLLGPRPGVPKTPPQGLHDLLSGPVDPVVDGLDGLQVRWVELPPPTPGVPTAASAKAPTEEPVDALSVRSAGTAWAAIRQASRDHQDRPWSIAATAVSDLEAGGGLEDLDAGDEAPRAAPPFPRSGEDAPRPWAREVGLVVHRVLENLDPQEDLTEQLARARKALPWNPPPPPEHRDAAARDAHALLQSFEESDLGRRFLELKDHLLGREVPFELGPGVVPGGSPAVATVSGQIDLIYRDPKTGDPVIVDFKTERVPPGSDPDLLALSHAPQARTYQLAVQAAWGTARPPAVEFWFLASGAVGRI